MTDSENPVVAPQGTQGGEHGQVAADTLSSSLPAPRARHEILSDLKIAASEIHQVLKALENPDKNHLNLFHLSACSLRAWGLINRVSRELRSGADIKRALQETSWTSSAEQVYAKLLESCEDSVGSENNSESSKGLKNGE
jgi:hypothetical protein